MAILTYPLNGVLYDAEDVETYLCTRTSGVFAADGHFPASVTGQREVTIGPGLAWMQNEEFHGKAIYNPENVALTIAEADAYQTRIDRIVLRFDKLLNMTELTVLQGTPSSNPQPPAITRDSLIYDLGLYTVTVKNSTVSLSEANVASTMLDESVCGIMEDAVTSIPTQELYDQWYSWFADIQTDTEEFERQFNIWFQEVKDQAETYMKENEQEFEDWRTEQKKDFDEWFDNLQYVLDGDVAGKLEVEIENAQDTADTALEQLASGWVEGFMTDNADGSGDALQAEDDDDNYAITLSRPICNCDEKDSIDRFYPVGSIYMSVNHTDPALLFGGLWQQIEDCFLLAAGANHAEGETGGAEAVTLSTSQIPEHTHTLPSHTHSIPSHTHSFSATTGSTTISGRFKNFACQSNDSNGILYADGVFSVESTTGETFGYAVNTATAGANQSDSFVMSAPHTHTVSGTTGATSGTSGATSGTSGATGSGASHNNMPPYLAVYMWQRIA